MESSLMLFLVLISLAIIHIVQAQDQLGFISLDCGLPASEPSRYKIYTGLWFSSDREFIQSGKTGRIKENQEKKLLKPYTTLRYFPDGIRNCYSLTVEKGRTYLIRATFMYGNYDGLDIKPVFDLYLGPNAWATIDLETRVNGTRMDVLHIPTSNSYFSSLSSSSSSCSSTSSSTTSFVFFVEDPSSVEISVASGPTGVASFATGVASFATGVASSSATGVASSATGVASPASSSLEPFITLLFF